MRLNYWFALLVLLFICKESRASDIVVDFTPYNCLTVGYDTVVQYVPNDNLVIINRSPSAFPVQYFRERNGVVVDTVVSSYGDTLWSTIIGVGDTLIAIRVLTMPGMCYGQRYHLQTSTQISQIEPLHFIQLLNRHLIIGRIELLGHLSVYDLSGQSMLSNTIQPAEKTIIDLQQLKAGWVVIVLDHDRKSVRRKFLLL
ncbi:MAG: hypothetical protein ACU4F9_05900 [Arcticibacter sp.]